MSVSSPAQVSTCRDKRQVAGQEVPPSAGNFVLLKPVWPNFTPPPPPYGMIVPGAQISVNDARA